MSPLLLLHLLGSVVVGYLGRRRRIGFLGFLIASLLITPILALLVLILTAETAVPESER